MKLEVKFRRGSYCAKLDGPDEKWRVRRDFEQGTPVKSRGVLVFNLSPGFYEIREGKLPTTKSWWRVDPTFLEPRQLPESFDLISHQATDGPLPGEPGCWDGEVCACGAEVTSFDEVGFPYCDEHTPSVPSVDFDAPF